MFWVFCNCCYVKPGQGKKRLFFMTSCSHILCNNCTRQDAKTCKKCGAGCMIVQCNAKMPDEVKEVFSDVNENIPNLLKVLNFQEGHRTKLLAHYRSHFYKYKAAKVYISELGQKLNNMKQKYEACKVVMNKQQSNLEMLIKKYQWYKEKFGIMEAASKRFMSSQVAFPPSNASKSKQNSCFTSTSGRQSTAQMNMSHNFTSTSGRQSSKFINLPHNRSNQCFTPMSGIQPLPPQTPTNIYRMNPKNSLTPESENSSLKSSNSSGSLSCSSRQKFLGFTPPSKSLENLSLANKNWTKGK